jgi:hypothetical protein
LWGYVVAVVITSPFLYFALSDPRKSAFNTPSQYEADLLNLVIPTRLEASGAGWSHVISNHFPGNYSERGGFLGLPVLVMIALYGWRRWRTPGGRFLLIALGVATLASLGSHLTVDGHRVIPLPSPFGHNSLTIPGMRPHLLPLLNNILPMRMVLYAALVAAVIVAAWMAAQRPGVLRVLLPALAVLLVLPNPAAGIWWTTYKVPPFFTKQAYRGCLAPNEVVLPEPVAAGGQANLWQVADDFRFRLSGGRIQNSPPSSFLHPDSIAQIAVGYPPGANETALFRAYFKAKGVTSVIVDPRRGAAYVPALDRIAKPQSVGGVLLYRVAGPARPCPAA